MRYQPHHRIILVTFCAYVLLSDCSSSNADKNDGFILSGDDERSLPSLQLPALGNGYLATQVDSPNYFVAGIYSGETTSPSHRAALSSPLVLSAGGVLLKGSLDMHEAFYERRRLISLPCSSNSGIYMSSLNSESCTWSTETVITQRWYAHRVLRHVFVHEVTVEGDGSSITLPRATATKMKAQHHNIDIDVGNDINNDGDNEWLDADDNLQVKVGPRRVYAVSQPTQAGFASPALRGASNPLVHIVVQRSNKNKLTKATATTSSEDVSMNLISENDCVRAEEWAQQEGIQYAAASLRGCRRAWSSTLSIIRAAELSGGEIPQVLTIITAGEGEEGDTYTFDATTADLHTTRIILTITVTSLDLPIPPTSNATALYALLIIGGAQYEAARALANRGLLFALHATAWREGIWSARIDAVGDSGPRDHVGDAQALTHASLYALSSILRSDWPFGLGPGGLSSAGYGGRSFWDTESFSWQTLNLLHPDIGASLLTYRLHRLPGARVKARANKGAAAVEEVLHSRASQIPWESAFSGVEACPAWAATGQKEIHVSADVSIAVAQHHALRGDIDWLRKSAWPLVRGIAEWWTRRTLADTPGAALDTLGAAAIVEAGLAGGYESGDCTDALSCPLHIRDVIAPTEFYTCDDNTFTNGVAKRALNIAVEIAAILGEGTASATATATASGAGKEGSQLVTQPKGWAIAASRLVIPYDTIRGAHPYFAGYQWGKPVQLLDVPLMSMLLGVPMSKKALASNIALYLPAFEGGAAFSYAVNALAAAEIGDWAKADTFLARNVDLFVAGPYQVWSEYPHGAGCPNFVTGAAGWLQALVGGFLHVRVSDSPPGLVLRPALPRGFARIELKGAALRGHRFDVLSNVSGTLVRLSSQSKSCFPHAHCPPSIEQWESALMRVAAHVLDVDAEKTASATRNTRWWSNRRGADHNGELDTDTTVLRSAAKEVRRMGTNTPLDSTTSGSGSGTFSPYTSSFDPDDPTSTPTDMIRARPWLRHYDGTPLYPLTEKGLDCIVVEARGQHPRVLRNEKDFLWAPANLTTPDDVDALPIIRITVGTCEGTF